MQLQQHARPLRHLFSIALVGATLALSGCGGSSDEDDSSSSSSSAGGLAGTWCANVSNNQNCWYFDNNTGSSTGTFYQQSINQYSGTLTNRMTWSANTSARTLTYRFTRSTLTNSSQNYDEPVNGSTYTFGYTVSATAFTFQNIVFYKR